MGRLYWSICTRLKDKRQNAVAVWAKSGINSGCGDNLVMGAKFLADLGAHAVCMIPEIKKHYSYNYWHATHDDSKDTRARYKARADELKGVIQRIRAAANTGGCLPIHFGVGYLGLDPPF